MTKIHSSSPIDYEYAYEQTQPIGCVYYEQSVTTKIHHFYLNGEISDHSPYINLIRVLQTAPETDIVYIHLNVEGGLLSIGIQIINAMQTSKAHVITSLESEAYSLGTMLFLAGKEFVVYDHSLMMFHNFSSMMYGKGNEQQVYLEATLQWFNELVNDLYYPFLSKSEITRMLKGEDIWMDSTEIKDRLIKLVEKKTSKSNSTKK